jgi:hypothetical protein
MTRWMWILTALGLVLWTLLAWGLHALVSGGGDWTGQWLSPALTPEWDALAATALVWAERLGVAIVWIVWALGSLALAATATLLTGVWRLSRGRSLPGFLRERSATLAQDLR